MASKVVSSIINLKDKNVLDAAKERIRLIFEKAKNGKYVFVNFSGGKDSLVVADLTIKYIDEENEKFGGILFIDEEVVWTDTINYVLEMFNHWNEIGIKTYYFQVEAYLDMEFICWDERFRDKWIREKFDFSIKDLKKYYLNKDVIPSFYSISKFLKIINLLRDNIFFLIGNRVEESLKRRTTLYGSRLNELGITFAEKASSLTGYKDNLEVNIKLKKRYKRVYEAGDVYKVYPIYDWKTTDVWKYIAENNLKYNKIYDKLFLLGLPLNRMRVSSLYHASAISARSMDHIKAIEPELYEKMLKRIPKLYDMMISLDAFEKAIKTLPPIFKSWREYRDFLLENLITEENIRKMFYKAFYEYEKNIINIIKNKNLLDKIDMEKIYKNEISAILVLDYCGETLKSDKFNYRKFLKE
ncbi:MAG: phosphoadenosine phosphosulfate reductase family protein [Candidatus Aenigmatarchaeota archaeon]